MFLDRRPYGYLCGIGDEELDDGSPFTSLLDIKESLSGYPTVSDSLIIGFSLPLSDNDFETVVLEVQRLSGTLYAITDNSYDFVLEYLLCFFEGEFLAGDYILDHSAKINLCHCSFIVYLFVSCIFPPPSPSSGGT